MSKLSELSKQGLLVAADVAEQAGDQVLSEALTQMAQGGWDEAFFALARVERAEHGIDDELAHAIAADATEGYEVGYQYGNTDIMIPEIPRVTPDLEGREPGDRHRGYWVEMSAFVPENFREIPFGEDDEYEFVPRRGYEQQMRFMQPNDVPVDMRQDAFLIQRGFYRPGIGSHADLDDDWRPDATLGAIILVNGIETAEATNAVENILNGLYTNATIIGQDVGLWSVRTADRDRFDIYLVPMVEED